MTPSPESMTVPVSVLCPTCREVHDAAKARTAWKGRGGEEKRDTSLKLSLQYPALLQCSVKTGGSLPVLEWHCSKATSTLFSSELTCTSTSLNSYLHSPTHHSLSTPPLLTCTAIYRPGTLNDSNMISAVYSLFSGVLSGGSVWGGGEGGGKGGGKGGEKGGERGG